LSLSSANLRKKASVTNSPPNHTGNHHINNQDEISGGFIDNNGTWHGYEASNPE
jgi:hypothetical protein